MAKIIHPNFRLVGIEPGRIYTPRFGFIDFREPIDSQILIQLYQSGCPYLQPTQEGKKALKQLQNEGKN